MRLALWSIRLGFSRLSLNPVGFFIWSFQRRRRERNKENNKGGGKGDGNKERRMGRRRRREEGKEEMGIKNKGEDRNPLWYYLWTMSFLFSNFFFFETSDNHYYGKAATPPFYYYYLYFISNFITPKIITI